MKPITKACKEYFLSSVNEDIKSREASLKHFKALTNLRITETEKQKGIEQRERKINQLKDYKQQLIERT